MAQQFSYVRLSEESEAFKGQLLKDYAVRARRISATYARFYLEQEQGGDVEKKGRFYWMALGAFASKTVACTLETWQVRTQAAMVSRTTREGLGKGNFWLFCDISGWHWYYCNSPHSFDMCLDKRSADTYVPAVKNQVAKLPWSGMALPKIKQMAVSSYIKSGFSKVKEFEREENERRRPAIQLAHLLAIAEHEQGVILQPLIYDDQDFIFWLKAQRLPGVSWVSPGLELVFTHACTMADPSSKSVAPDDTHLEDLRSRMKWIAKAADKFHSLMQTKRSYMEGELRAMAGWVGLTDT
jgi:hypothetical protein